MNPSISLDSFTSAYIECALWSSTDGYTDPLNRVYSLSDIAPPALNKMISDCTKFQLANEDLLNRAECSRSNEYSKYEQAGHDFWLTRNGHGAGFWDGDWMEPHGDLLDKAASIFGECNLYVGDDGLLYAE